ncbi:MAG: NADH:ubiquinone reductase (Na(+)-transporting) subunit F [Chitinivibrionales bacterium]|nr:NADH:ubiquinone reductase (Na(+)-transporting) subunit F [Chitinivibrionales bacterium]
MHLESFTMGLVGTVGISVLIFTLYILILVGIMILAKAKLAATGDVKLHINDDESLTKTVPAGNTVLTTLSSTGLLLPSACGGGGTCGLCKVQILDGAGDILPTELGHISRQEAKDKWRLGCQVKVKNDLKLKIPDEIFNIKKFNCTVRSNKNVATFIKELILDIDEGKELNFKAGGYIQIDIPAFGEIPFTSFDIQEKYRDAWDNFKLWDIVATSDEPVFRAYSMANHPAEGNRVMLNVRIATPPPKTDLPPGIASSYIFSLKPGDKVTISGPFGEFFVKDTEREMCFIGGGAGMAPMRSHIYHQFHTEHTKRKTTFWYGARSVREMFYHDEFLEIQKNNPNFEYQVALSDPQPEDNWDGPSGFIHQVAHDRYLKDHEDPSEIEYYLCGPPMMLAAVNKMLYDLGVEQEMIAYDEFG